MTNKSGLRCAGALAAVLSASAWLGCSAQTGPGVRTVTATNTDCHRFEFDVRTEWDFRGGVDVQASIQAGDASVGSAQLRAQWIASGHGSVVTQMDAATQDWAMMREQLCADQSSGRVSTEAYARRSECADTWLRDLRTLLQAARMNNGSVDFSLIQQLVNKQCSPAG